MLLLLLLSSAVLQAQLLLSQTRQSQFVEIGTTARIPCIAAEKIEDGGLLLSWFKSCQDGMLILVKSCVDDKENSQGKFVCKKEEQNVMLQIANAQRTDSGFYVCAKRWNRSLFGSSLIVGDSYTPSSRVMLLQPPVAPAPQSEQSGHLACVVHGVSSLVQVSWHVPGGLCREGRTRLVQNSSGSLTFLSLLRVPARGEPFACEVRFNASGPSIKRNSIKRNSTWPPASAAPENRSCPSNKVPLAVRLILAFLLLLLLVFPSVWICCPRRGSRSKVSEAPSPETPQGRHSSGPPLGCSRAPSQDPLRSTLGSRLGSSKAAATQTGIHVGTQTHTP